MTSTVSDAIAAVYACATEPPGWPDTLQRIADCFGDVGGLLIYRRDDGSFATVVSASLRHCVESYERVWWRHDIRAARSMDYGYRDFSGAITDRHGVTDEEVATHPIYTQFLAPFGLRWTASVEVSPHATVQVGLSVLRSSSKEAFGDDELDLLTDLGRHAEQSLRLGLRLIDAEAINLGLGEALDRLAVGAFVIDGAARLAFANAAARRMVGRAFSVAGDRLACRAPADQKRLSAMLRSTALVSSDARSAASLPSPLVVEADGSRLAIYVLPIRSGALAIGAAANPLNVVLAVDLAPGAPLDPGLVRDVYGLTLGESRVAALVGAGISPREAASRLSVSEETVRSVLKRVFAKLDVSRQAELADLFTRLKAVGEAQ